MRHGGAGDEAEGLTEEQMEGAFRHGFEARERFADRPFDEVESWLRSSWEGTGSAAAWSRVSGIVRRGYENYKGASLDAAADLAPEALDRRDRVNGDAR